MVGFYAVADESQPIRVDLDNELAGPLCFVDELLSSLISNSLIEARWFTREEVQAVLAHRDGSIITRREYKKFDDHDEGNTGRLANANAGEEKKVDDAPPFRVPPATAIAGMLIRDWVEGKIGVAVEKAEKGHL